MEPREIPKAILEKGIGVPLTFVGPEGTDIGELQVLILEDMRAVLEGRPPTSAKFISWWQPNEDERKRLMDGAPIRLTIIGATHVNPMSLEVTATLEGFI